MSFCTETHTHSHTHTHTPFCMNSCVFPTTALFADSSSKCWAAAIKLFTVTPTDCVTSSVGSFTLKGNMRRRCDMVYIVTPRVTLRRILLSRPPLHKDVLFETTLRVQWSIALNNGYDVMCVCVCVCVIVCVCVYVCVCVCMSVCVCVWREKVNTIQSGDFRFQFFVFLRQRAHGLLLLLRKRKSKNLKERRKENEISKIYLNSRKRKIVKKMKRSFLF